MRFIFQLPGLIVLAAALYLTQPDEAGVSFAFLGGLISLGGSLLKKGIQKVFTRRPPTALPPRPPSLPAVRTGSRVGRSTAVALAADAAVSTVSFAAGRRSMSRRRDGRRTLEWRGQPDPQLRDFVGGRNPHQPLTDITDDVGRAIAVEPAFRETTVCPTGYVAVDRGDGTTVCMLKGPAKRAGLWKGRKKPPISASDWNKLKVANRVKKKARKIAETAGGKVKGLPKR